MKARRAFGAALLATLVLAACSKEKDVDLPSELVDFKPTAKVQRLWSASFGTAEPDLRLGLGLATDGDRVFGASHDGNVVALNVKDGRAAWRTKSGATLSAGPGAGAGLVVVGSSTGDVIALEAASGQQRWRVRVNGELLAAPAASERVVVVRTVSGLLIGLNPADGRELWREEQQVPRLTLRGTSAPTLVGDTALCGFDNGRVLAVGATSGEVLWDAAIAPARGRTELERLVDIDSSVKVNGADVFVVGFQGRAAMLALDTGQIWWSRELSSYRGLDFDDEAVYVSTSTGEVEALRRRTGVDLWKQDGLKFRRLSAPTAFGAYVVVGDLDGQLHWLDKATGVLAARVSLGGRISNAPLVVGESLIAIDDKGRVAAFRAAPGA